MERQSQANSERKTEEEFFKPSRATRVFIIWRKLRKSKLAVAGLGIVLFMSAIALLAPIIAPYGPEWSGAPSRAPPSMDYIFGTDAAGRDMLSLVMYGARNSLLVGFGAVFIEIVIATSLGMTAGYFGGLLDEIIMRITDVFLTLPTTPLLIVAICMFSARGIFVMIFLMGVLGWPFMCRVVRSEFLSLRESTYVEAARSLGATRLRIIVRHILPNILSVIIVLATMDIPWYIFYEATLTYLGFGDPRSASWGVLLEKGYLYMQSAWWMITFPGLALLFTSLGFNIFGDGLRDALDVKAR